eukprot:CAMPEP_0202697406 /NCGR_PEP_ID=MMETSP1385-20130828/10734_1 /ASSEMBLY_ACC=CAM_ASM_000861 /TAXON_ID=933848 /ORGANISM="Elphidium margaritaceum" /LENGTH=435 /DNA_ID=CAMNT_0049353859 /DNA_START=222 /DNA_END=1529 /DNA_ORIENTATION=-
MKCVKSGQRIYIQGAAMTPEILIEALCQHAHNNNLRDIELIHIHLGGTAPFVTNDAYRPHFRDNSLFIGGNVRKYVNMGLADFTPIFLSEIPQLFEDPDFVVDVSLIQTSPPDKHGYCSLGTSVDCTRSALLASTHCVGLINEHVPRTHGDGHVHISHFDAVYYDSSTPLPEHRASLILDPITEKIGRAIANELIPDKACLQMGIGNIPDAVLQCLHNHHNLGIHTEMFSDGVLDLVDMGIISNSCKFHHRGKLATSFAMGTQRLYDFVDDNPLVLFCDTSYINDTEVIRANPLTHAINSCIEIDITGQVCADSIGTKMFSGIGGQMDFMRGAALSPGGKAIMAMPSTTNKGTSKILSVLKSGAGVVTTRAHVQYIVTEYGVAKLYGKTLRERARLLIELAHPDHREELEKDAFERFGKLTLNGSDGDQKIDGDD